MSKMKWVYNPRGKRFHVQDICGKHTACGWRADRMTPADAPSRDGARICRECAAKLRSGKYLKLPWVTPRLTRHDRAAFSNRIRPKSVREQLQLEAAQKGYWGIL